MEVSVDGTNFKKVKVDGAALLMDAAGKAINSI